MPAIGCFKKLALVGHVRSDLYQALEKCFPKKVLIIHGSTLINSRGHDHTHWSDVLFVVQHDITTLPYKNVWLDHIAKRNTLANQSLGVINVLDGITVTQKDLLHEFMLNERHSLINGYYSLRISADAVDPNDLKIIINAVDAAIMRD
jgi:hypothetical protein